MSNHRHWRASLAARDAAVRRWLPTAGSLTAGVRAVSAEFGVRRVGEGWRKTLADEAGPLGSPLRRKAWTREVLLCDGVTPLVFAHSVVAAADLAAWPWLRGLGNRPLGEVLFQHHGVARGRLVFRRLDARHPLYHAARAATGTGADGLWARRSLFTLRGGRLLVTEVFLPELLRR